MGDKVEDKGDGNDKDDNDDQDFVAFDSFFMTRPKPLLIVEDQKSEAESMIGKRAGIETMEIAVKRGGTMIVGAEIVIGIMIVIMGMIESEIEKEIGPATMIQGVVGGHVHGQENVPGTMIATGVMIGTSCSWNEESGNCLSFVFMKINLSFWRDGFCDGTRNCLVHLHDYCLMKD
ncbi:hypothetical protein TEA_027271 [Camellia sinensis var. sinensis]|uniref:Uncharacterized protein n=1 Tax=Camellia sinensis var. sinensis TaxID=542762 RepID=A0A4V3WJ84_CAMSN|nr:hypothetical protein TEA_027271 [Camellia sinensis var. sinensis]